MTCKECLYEKLCPFNISSTEAERCKTYDPKADYVKVVRCKDCTHHEHDDGWCKIQANYTGDSEYCSLGIRKEDTNET